MFRIEKEYEHADRKVLLQRLREEYEMSEIQGELCEIIAREIERVWTFANEDPKDYGDKWEELKRMCESFLSFKESMMDSVWEDFWNAHGENASDEFRDMIRRDVMNKQGKDGYWVLWEYARDTLEMWNDKGE